MMPIQLRTRRYHRRSVRINRRATLGVTIVLASFVSACAAGPAPVVRQPVAPPPAFVPPPQGPPPISIRYVGSLTKADLGLVVVLRDEATGLAHTSQAGQVVDGRYRLLSATYDAVEIAHLDGRGRQRIARER